MHVQMMNFREDTFDQFVAEKGFFEQMRQMVDHVEGHNMHNDLLDRLLVHDHA